jgi:hypothetical protein
VARDGSVKCDALSTCIYFQQRVWKRGIYFANKHIIFIFFFFCLNEFDILKGRAFGNTFYTLEDLKWDKFDNVPLINIELDTTNVNPFIIINPRGIFLFSKSDLFINTNDIDIK